MATIDFRIKNLKAADGTRATLAELTGSVTDKNRWQFMNVMDALVAKGVRNLILDCANVKRVTTTGLGVLLKYRDTFESMDGHLALVRVPSRVMLKIETRGFNAVLEILPDEAAALRSFAGVPPVPAPSPRPPVAKPAESRGIVDRELIAGDVMW